MAIGRIVVRTVTADAACNCYCSKYKSPYVHDKKCPYQLTAKIIPGAVPPKRNVQ